MYLPKASSEMVTRCEPAAESNVYVQLAATSLEQLTVYVYLARSESRAADRRRG